jgi:demethylmenaquinone methyltransferase/2-methoxy-6-polyprenyl-1,4-benzoquinol methylase
MFSAIAGRYDLLNSLLSLRRDRAWRRSAASRAAPGTGGLALDVATGTGELARHLARQNGEVRVIGVDFCPEMLAKARAKFAGSPDGARVHLAIGDVLQLPFPDNTFDCVTIGFGLRNVTDIAATFAEMARVARPGGRVVSLELTLPSSSLLRGLYGRGLSRIAPLAGRVVSGNREAYTYLPDSILEFPSPEDVAQVMRDAGLGDVEVHRFTFGAATVHTGVKRG